MKISDGTTSGGVTLTTDGGGGATAKTVAVVQPLGQLLLILIMLAVQTQLPLDETPVQ